MRYQLTSLVSDYIFLILSTYTHYNYYCYFVLLLYVHILLPAWIRVRWICFSLFLINQIMAPSLFSFQLKENQTHSYKMLTAKNKLKGEISVDVLGKSKLSYSSKTSSRILRYFVITFLQLLFKSPFSLTLAVQRPHQRVKL